jgi:hypothetical protein
MLKYVSVKLTKTLIPMPVTDLLCDICGGVKGERFGGKIDESIQKIFHISVVIFHSPWTSRLMRAVYGR